MVAVVAAQQALVVEQVDTHPPPYQLVLVKHLQCAQVLAAHLAAQPLPAAMAILHIFPAIMPAICVRVAGNTTMLIVIILAHVMGIILVIPDPDLHRRYLQIMRSWQQVKAAICLVKLAHVDF